MLCKLESDFFFLWRCEPPGAMGSSLLKFLAHTQRPTTFGRTPADEWSPRRRNLYLTIHNTHKRQISMPPAGFEPTIPTSERPLRSAVRISYGRELWSVCIQGFGRQPSWPFGRHSADLPDKAYKTTQTRMFTWMGVQVNRHGQEPL
jgi:hypothetical protein